MSYRITAIVPAPEGTRLDRDGATSTVVAFGLRALDTPLPITQTACDVCRRSLAASHWLNAEVAGRRNSDSRYGFVAKHVGCQY